MSINPIKLKNTGIHNWLLQYYAFKGLEESKEHIKGKVLDVGCGNKPYKEFIEPLCIEYIGLDREISGYGTQEIDVMGSADAIPFEDETFDTVVSFQVMEHLPEPVNFLKEAYRILKPGGKIIITTPFLWGIHEAPYDFYRYTQYGLEHLIKKAGFKALSITPKGSFWSVWFMLLHYFIIRLIPKSLKFMQFIFYPLFIVNQIWALLLDDFTYQKYPKDFSIYTTIAEK